MISPYHNIVQYEEDDWQDFLEKCLLIDVFAPVIKEYKDPTLLKCVIRYIAYTYSMQSDKIVLSMEWHENKKKIFEFILAKPEKTIYQDLVHLKNDGVLQAVTNWLEFQDSDAHKQLCVLRDLRVEMQISSLSNIKKSSGECDYDQKFKNAEYAIKLKQMIKELESEMVQNNSQLKDAVKEVKTETNKRNSRSVGSYAVN